MHEFAAGLTAGGVSRFVGQVKVKLPVPFWQILMEIICPITPPAMVLGMLIGSYFVIKTENIEGIKD